MEIQNAQHGNDMLRDLKRSLKTKVRKVERDEDAVHVLDFPALPQGLQDTLGLPAYETWWQNAYGERKQPLGEQHFPHTVALRKSSRLLSPANPLPLPMLLPA